MKFLHTADWQVGMKAVHVGTVGRRVRDERLAAVCRVVQAAENANAEFMLVAGDTTKAKISLVVKRFLGQVRVQKSKRERS